MPDRLDYENPIVLHVLAYDVSRGAEKYARSLVDALNHRSGRHLVVTLFSGEDGGLDPDISLDVPLGPLRRAGVDPRVVSRLRKAIDSSRADVLVAHGGEPAKYLALAARRTPYIYLVIGSAHPLLRNPVRRALRRLYVRRAAAIVAVSALLAEDVASVVTQGPGKVAVFPNGRDPSVYAPGSSARRAKPTLLFVGRLEGQKRPDWFVDVVRAVRARGADVAARMAGGGELLEALRPIAAQAGVEMLGPRDDVPALMADADLLVLTSRPPEGMPGVLIEAGMAGLAVVTTDVPGAREVVRDGETGMIVPVDDKEGLAEAVLSLLADAGRLDRMGQAAREHCIREFSLEASVDAWEELIAGLAS